LMMLKRRKSLNAAMIQAILQVALADFQALYFTESFKVWQDHWPHCM
jgi:hypothetical protein